MKIFMDNPDIDSDTLGLKLDEAILKELPPLRRGLGTLALLAAIAPLLGLLGTVNWYYRYLPGNHIVWYGRSQSHVRRNFPRHW